MSNDTLGSEERRPLTNYELRQLEAEADAHELDARNASEARAIVQRAQHTPATIDTSYAAILRAAVAGGITRENVEVVERLGALAERAEANRARIEFFRALAAMRKSMPAIYADNEVRIKAGQVAYRYASPQAIKEALEPHLQRHGLMTMASQRMDGNSITVTLTVAHEGGHSEQANYTTRISPGTALMTVTQCDAAAATAAERQALIRFFGLRVRIREDEDPRNEGVYISEEDAKTLRERALACGADERKFLKFAGVDVKPDDPPNLMDYFAIMSAKLPALDAALIAKERDKGAADADH